MSDQHSHPRFYFDLARHHPEVHVPGGGTIAEASSKTFPVLDGLAVFLLVLEPGAARIPH